VHVVVGWACGDPFVGLNSEGSTVVVSSLGNKNEPGNTDRPSVVVGLKQLVCDRLENRQTACVCSLGGIQCMEYGAYVTLNKEQCNTERYYALRESSETQRNSIVCVQRPDYIEGLARQSQNSASYS
jgi:hypothetical protein